MMMHFLKITRKKQQEIVMVLYSNLPHRKKRNMHFAQIR